MKNTKVRAVALSVVAAMITTLGLQEPSYASSPNPGYLTEPVFLVSTGDLGGPMYYQVTTDRPFPVGDCFLNSPSTVRIYQDMSEDWFGSMYTTHTNNADIWHNSLYFKNSAGTTILTLAQDGPRMTQTFHQYGFTNHIAHINTTTFAALAAATTVLWQGAC